MTKMSSGKSQYRKGYDPLYWNKLAEGALESTTKDERLVWFQHPCTQALLHELQASVAAKVNAWINGAFANSESVDHTAMAQAKVLGQTQACDEMIDLVNEIGKSTLESDIDGDTPRRT